MNGNVECNVNNVTYNLNKGDCGLCLPYDIHSYCPQKETLYWVLVFSEDFVNYFSKQIKNKTGNGFNFKLGKSVEDYIKERLINNPNPDIMTLKSCLYAICNDYQSSVKIVSKNNKHNEITLFIIDYISQNYQEKISLNDIAKKLGYDYNYTSRYFRKTFNMTFSEFLSIYRLENATRLLESTDKSVLLIANESGFQSLRNFNRFFKEKVGVSPTEYRKMSFKQKT